MSEETTKEVALYEDADAKLLGLPTPGAINMLSTFCAQFVNTPLCPPSLSKGNPAANMMAVVLTGREMSLSPMQCLRGMFLGPDGRIGMEGSLMMAVMRSHGISFTWHRMDNEGCKVTAKRKDSGEELTVEFLVEDAKRAGIYQRDKSQWPKYPKTMCRHRCEGEIFRGLCSDFGGVSIYERSELEDMDYETVSAPSNGQPEVQAEPAKAGRKPKDRPIDVKAETVAEPAQTEPQPVAQTATPSQTVTSPVKEPQKFYVLSSAVTLPAVDKIEQEQLEKFQMAASVTNDIVDAMKTSDQATRSTGISHYVLTFNDGKASILHTSKVAAPAPKEEPKMYIVAAEDYVKSATSAEEIEAKASVPHPVLSTCELMAVAEAKKYQTPYVVMCKQGNTYVAVSRFAPSAATAPDQPKEGSPEDQALREICLNKYNWLKTNIPSAVPMKQKAGVVDQYLLGFMGITDRKDFKRDVNLFMTAMDACEKELMANPIDFVPNAPAWGKAARERTAFTPVEEKPAPQMSNSEIAAMAKYYQERSWSGNCTSLAEQYRRTVKPDPIEFQKMLEFSGIKGLTEKNAAAYFWVALAYDKETSKKFAMGVDGSEYGDTLTAIRDRFDGADLKDISATKFVVTLESILSGKPADEPKLFD